MLQEKKQDEIVIRGYREADHDQVQRVCLGTGTDPTFAQPQMQQFLLNAFCNYYIEQEAENCFVADDGSGVVGYILCARDAGVWKKTFPECYAPGVMLGVASDNEKGKNFYRKYGFSVLEEGPQEIVMGMKL